MAGFSLAPARQEVLGALGIHLQGRGVTVDVLDEALRMGLEYVNRHAAAVERDVTLATDGRRQDFGALTGEAIYHVQGVYEQTARPGIWGRLGYAVVDEGGVVELLCPAVPAAGDVLRVRALLRYAIRDLDGAPATTLPPILERAVVLAAAGEVVELLLGQAMVSGVEVSEARAEAMRRVARTLRTRAGEQVGVTRASSAVLAWREAGGWS